MKRKTPIARPATRRRPRLRPLAWESLEDRAVPTLPAIQADFASAFALGGAGTVTVRDVQAGVLEGPWVVGSFTGTVDFDPGSGVASLTSAGGEDAFVASYDRMGRLRWARSFGGPGDDRINGLASGQSEVTVVGAFSGSVEFGPGYGTTRLSSEGGTDAFAVQFDVADGSLKWTRGFGGLGDDEAAALATSGWDGLFIVGSFSGTANFDPAFRLAGSPRKMTSAGGTDVFYVTLTPGGDWWGPSSRASRAGGPGNDVAVKAGVSTILGTFEGTADLSFGDGINLNWIPQGPMLRTSAGGRDGFLVTLWSVGYDPRRIQIFGAAGDDRPTDMGRVDNSGHTPFEPSYYYVAGAFEGRVDFGGADDAGVRNASGGADGFLARYDLGSGALDWVATVGGPGDDAVEAIAADYFGVSATGGFTGAVDFDPGVGVRMLRDSGRGGAFLWRVESSGKVELARAMGGEGATARGVGVAAMTYLNYFVVGRFEGPIDVDPSPDGSRVLDAPGGAFVVKLQDVPDMIPVAVDDMYRVEAGGALVIWPRPTFPEQIGLQANDRFRPGGNGWTERLTNPEHGHISTDFEGQVAYHPDAGFVGTDSFTYRLKDGDLFSNVATVTFTVVEAGAGPPPTSPDVYLDRGASGVWTWSTGAGSHQILAEDPQGIAAAADGTLYLDLGARGLWSWSEGEYRKINDADPQGIVAGPGGRLAVDYGAFGLWIWDGLAMRRINAANPEGLAFDPAGSLYVDYGSFGLWSWRERAGFRKLNGADPEGLAAGAGGVLFVDYGAFGLWGWREGAGFRRLNAANPESLAASPAGSLLVDYGSYGLWSWAEASGFARLDGGDARRIAVGARGAFFVDLGPRGVFRWAGGALTRLEIGRA